MKTSSIATIAASLLLASVSAFADGATYDYPQPVTSSVSRAEVRADLNAALAIGAVSRGEHSYVVPATGVALSRAQVRSELAVAIANDTLSRGESVFVAEATTRLGRPVMASAPVTRSVQ